MRDLETIVEDFLADHPCSAHRWLAYSGGLDSTVLLHLLSRQGQLLQAVHVHHGLSANADAWSTHCAATTGAWGVPLREIRVCVDAADGGVEQGARNARYNAFAQLLESRDQLLMGHHADDQAETFLLRLMRGAGVEGLSAMPYSRALGAGLLLRPLLQVPRSQLLSYARRHRLQWIEDESNTELRFERNYLRQRVLPALNARWPATQRISVAASHLRESAQLLREVADADLEVCGRRAERLGESVALAELAALSAGRRNNLIRGWLHLAGAAPLTADQLAELWRQLVEAAADRSPVLEHGPVVFRRYRQRLYLTPQLPIAAPADTQQLWNGRDALSLPGGGCLSPSPGWPPGDYMVRYRRGGERARPLGRQHSQALKKLLQEQGLEPWLRDRVPLVYEEERLLAVGDLFLCQIPPCAKPPSAPPRWRWEAFFD
ncbi:tRNA lysidine(34) synthetase TilS [Microbulbifer sp. TYP-18]|uniref:tRNA lysidine(34) synthetase TilS n=1 Tax=Microbulbifer sp. TYP-18 TaxID=3230024 RepID=UPI0034C5C7B8